MHSEGSSAHQIFASPAIYRLASPSNLCLAIHTKLAQGKTSGNDAFQGAILGFLCTGSAAAAVVPITECLTVALSPVSCL